VSWCPGRAMAGLVLTEAGDEVNFDVLFHNMVKLLASKSEMKDENGNAKFADLCEFLCAEFPGADERAEFSKKLQELDRKCCDILGAEVAACSFTTVVPAPPAGSQPVGQPPSMHWVHLWQLGFAEESAVRGLKLSMYISKRRGWMWCASCAAASGTSLFSNSGAPSSCDVLSILERNVKGDGNATEKYPLQLLFEFLGLGLKLQ
jgi:hypothetical protein